ncbi:MAG: hypothetical protein ACI4RK_00950 [Oscillospiraceae bacterium]
MSITYNLTATEALNLFLGGAECGLPESLLAKTEKEMGAAIHPTVREFAAKYYYLIPNSGRTRVGDFHLAHVGSEAQVDDLLVIGRDDTAQYAVLSPDSRVDPPVFMGRRNGENIEWSRTGLHLEGFLAKVIASGLSPYCEAAFGEKPDEIAQIAEIFGADVKQLDLGSEWGFPICFNEERQELAVFLWGDGELKNAAVYVQTSNEIERIPFGGNTNAELKEFFEAEFYGNSINCNYEYALLINSERARRSKDSGAPATQTAELERLSARCLWALGRFAEAEELLNSAAAAFTDSLIHTYTALSNMLGECGEAEKSEKAFDAVAALSELAGDYDALGMLYQTRGQKLDKDISTVDRAIELYDKAIEQFQKMPRPNKHDIARTQQLRGEARRRKKEMLKTAQNPETAGDKE